MASTIEIVDRLLAATGHGTLDTFIASLVERGEDKTEARISLYKATGLMFDLRTVKSWMTIYG